MANRLIVNILSRLGLVPDLVVVRPAANSLRLEDIFDGFLWVQKRKRNIYTRWRLKYGNDNWKSGTKLWKPKKNITTCPECGSFHEFHTICRVCFDLVDKKTQAKLQELGESKSNRSWFEPNVAQVKNPVSKDESKVIREA